MHRLRYILHIIQSLHNAQKSCIALEKRLEVFNPELLALKQNNQTCSDYNDALHFSNGNNMNNAMTSCDAILK